MRSDATSRRARLDAQPAREPVEFSVEDAILNTWVEDTSPYLQLDPTERKIGDVPAADAS